MRGSLHWAVVVPDVPVAGGAGYFQAIPTSVFQLAYISLCIDVYNMPGAGHSGDVLCPAGFQITQDYRIQDWCIQSHRKAVGSFCDWLASRGTFRKPAGSLS